MMTLGLLVSFLITFLLLPALLNIFSSENEINLKDTEKSFITSLLGSIAKKFKFSIFLVTGLIIVASFFGIFGGWFAAIMTLDVTTYDFFKGFKTWFHPFDAFFGIIKSFFFGFTITSIACFQGYNAKGGAQGVGEAATVTVVTSCVMIVVLDYIISEILI